MDEAFEDKLGNLGSKVTSLAKEVRQTIVCQTVEVCLLERVDTEIFKAKACVYKITLVSIILSLVFVGILKYFKV